MKEHKMK